MYIYRPPATINNQSKNWKEFGYHGMGKIWSSNSNILFLKSMQLAVHPNLREFFFLKIIKSTQYGHAMLGPLENQNANSCVILTYDL